MNFLNQNRSKIWKQQSKVILHLKKIDIWVHLSSPGVQDIFVGDIYARHGSILTVIFWSLAHCE